MKTHYIVKKVSGSYIKDIKYSSPLLTDKKEKAMKYSDFPMAVKEAKYFFQYTGVVAIQRYDNGVKVRTTYHDWSKAGAA